MKRKFFLILSPFIVSFTAAFAQDPTPAEATPATAPVPAPTQKEIEVTIPLSEFDRLRAVDRSVPALEEGWKAKIDSVRKADQATIDSLQKVIDAKNAAITSAQEEVIQYRKDYISLASNFLYMPYDSYSISDIVKPAYERVKDTELGKEYKVRFDLLFNYEAYAREILDFCKRQEHKPINAARITKDAAEINAAFNALPAVAAFKKYDDYKNTYLGRYIFNIENTLSTVRDGTEINKIKDALAKAVTGISAMLENAQ